MAKYLVTWEIDIEDENCVTPYSAAFEAWVLRNNEGSTANVFIVTDKETDIKYQVDLESKKTRKLKNV